MAINVPGYSLPKGVTTEEQVRELQRQLGVNVDGKWGPKSEAAYNSANGSVVPQSYKDYLSEFRSLLKPQRVSYNGASQAELEAALRPSYDIAIKNRIGQTATNKANIDADAAARGMGASTWVTDVKGRQQDAEASDVAGLEASYVQQLQAALQQERANQFQADQFNANSQAQALQAALGLAGNFYGQDLAAKKTSSGGKPTGLTDAEIAALLNGTTPKSNAVYGNIATQRQEAAEQAAAKKKNASNPYVYGNIATQRLG